MTTDDDDLCLECELGHPCQVHDRQPPPSPSTRWGWLRRLVGRPHFPAPGRVAGQGDPPARPPTRGGRVPPGAPPPRPRMQAAPPAPPPPPRRPRRHVCDDRCVCPNHGTQLIYWPAGDDHACQDIDCVFGHGGAP